MAILELERLGPTSQAAPSAASAPAPVPGLEVAARAKPAEETSNLERWFHGWSTYVTPPHSPKVSGIWSEMEGLLNPIAGYFVL